MSSVVNRLTNSNFPLLKWVAIGALAELVIVGICYAVHPEINEVFRHAARYSGRLSLFLYLFTFGYFALTFHATEPAVLATVKKLVTIFCVCHFIHFGFLVTNVLMNEVALIPFKLAGGFLGYLMILLYPFLIDRVRNKKLHFIYFLYLGIVMIATYMARIKGDFPGAEPGPVHYFGVGATVLALLAFGWMIFGARPRVQGEV